MTESEVQQDQDDTFCRYTGTRAERGACPRHGGDACLVTAIWFSVEVERLKVAFAKYSRHLRGCKIRPDSPIMRALTPKGETFVSVPCSCGFDDARAVLDMMGSPTRP